MRLMSVSPDYQFFVFTRNIQGKPHIIKASLDGEMTLDLGVGYAPFWADNRRILFSDRDWEQIIVSGRVTMLINDDGTERREISGLGDSSQRVFIP